jgi:adenylate cyclase
MRLRFRTRIFLAVAGVACLALATALFGARQEAERRAGAEIAERFARAGAAFRQLQALRRRIVADEVDSLARSHPLFRTVLSTASAEDDLGFGGLPSLGDRMRDANLRLRSLLPSLPLAERHEVFAVASAGGELIFDKLDPERFGDDLSGIAVLREAAGGAQAIGLWSRAADLPAGMRLVPEPPPRAVYEVIAQPIAFGDEVHGLVLAGGRLDRAALEDLRAIADVHVALVAGGELLATTLDEAQAAGLTAGVAQALAARGGAVPAGSGAGALAPALPVTGLRLGGERFLVARAAIAPEPDAPAAGRDPSAAFLLLRSLDAELGFVRALERAAALLAAAVLAGALAVGFALARGITRPIAQLARAAERVGRGDLDTQVSIATGDELEGLGDTFNGMVRGLRERDRIRRTFERHVSKHVADEILRHPEAVARAGERREVSVLFADLGGFSALAERSDPEAVVARLNEYFAAVCEAVLAEEGTVNELLGDGILAFWGAPLAQPDHAARACRAALACRERLARLTGRWQDSGLGALRFRIGVHTGPVVVGEMGTPERSKYGVIGDAVNLASRLEGANRFYGTELLVSGETRAAAGAGFVFREVDRVRVAGRTAPVTLFEPLAAAGDGRDDPPALRDGYESALAAWRAGDAARAAERLAALRAAFPDDGPTAALLARVAAGAGAAPEPGWDGVHELPTK